MTIQQEQALAHVLGCYPDQPYTIADNSGFSGCVHYWVYNDKGENHHGTIDRSGFIHAD